MYAAKSILLLLFITLSLATVNTTEESSVADSEQSKAAVEESHAEAEPTASTPKADEANAAKINALLEKLQFEAESDATENVGIKKPSTFLGTYAWLLLSNKLKRFIVFYLVENEDHEEMFEELANTFSEVFFVRVDLTRIVGEKMKELGSQTYPVISCQKFNKSIPAFTSTDEEELKRIICEAKDLNIGDFEEYVPQIKGDEHVAGADKASDIEKIFFRAITAELDAVCSESHDSDAKSEKTSNVSPADDMKLEATSNDSPAVVTELENTSNVSPAVDTKLEATSNLSPTDDTELEEGSKGSHGN